MKNIFKYGFLGLTLAATLPSCIDTLDTKPASSFSSDVIWGSKATVEAFINSIYDGVIRDAGYAGSGSSIGWESRTPNSVKASQVGEGIDNFTTELGISTSNDFGVNFSGSLRKCNLVIKNVEENGLNIFGFTVIAQKDEIIKISETQDVYYIYTENI